MGHYYDYLITPVCKRVHVFVRVIASTKLKLNIALHQREYFNKVVAIVEDTEVMSFCSYWKNWNATYSKGTVQIILSGVV